MTDPPPQGPRLRDLLPEELPIPGDVEARIQQSIAGFAASPELPDWASRSETDPRGRVSDPVAAGQDASSPNTAAGIDSEPPVTGRGPSGAPATVPPVTELSQERRRRRSPWLMAAAAAAVVVLAVPVAASLGGRTASQSDSEVAAGAAEPNLASPEAADRSAGGSTTAESLMGVPRFARSGTLYLPGTLASQLGQTLSQLGPSGSDAKLDVNPGCISALAPVPDQQPVLVDAARLEDESGVVDALIVAFRDASGLQVWAVAPDCTAEDPKVLSYANG